jgi:NAD(P)-dependent dehydrogenase (short-subunit alcohol dehydrogenase family)
VSAALLVADRKLAERKVEMRMKNSHSYEAHAEPQELVQVLEGENTRLSRRQVLAAGATGAAALAASALEASAQQLVVPTRVSPQGRFAGRVVLITGATSGIGEGSAYAFAREGARVYFCGRRESLGKQVEARIKGFGGDATFQRTDVRREGEVQAFVNGCVARYGRIDIAFNNAGILQPTNAPLAEQPTEGFLDVMSTNVLGYFLCMKHELPVLLRNQPWGAHGTRGVIVNNASTSGHRGYAGISPYSTSKHAVLGLTKCAALEYGERGVRINSISPGGVDTPMRRQAGVLQGYSGPQPAPMPNIPRRVSTVEEMADVVMFLASDAGSSLQGTDLDVTGGNLTGAFLPRPPQPAR